MDREIPKEERLKAKRATIIKWGCGAAAAVIVIVILLSMMRKSVYAEDITIVTADSGTIETSVNASGRVQPAFEEIINSPIATRIVEVYSREGDSVEAGTPLLRLDLQSAETEINNLSDERRMKQYELEQTRLNNHTFLSSLEMQVKVKEMDVNRKKVEVNNERRLDSLGSGTGDRVREAELAYNTGKLELEQLRQQLANERQVRDASLKMKRLELDIFEKNFAEKMRTLEDARIRSPRAATLTYVNNQIGQQIGQGEKVAVISDLSHFKVDADISDSYGDRLSVGSRAIVRVGKTRLEGSVSNLTPLSKNGVISFTVTLADDDNPRLRSGLKTDVYVMCDIKDEAVRIATGPYFKGPGEYELFVQTGDGELSRRKVRLGDSNFDYVEVVEGLKPGDKVVISDMSNFNNSNTLKLNHKK
ncbi:MAG: HlyD family efflux transporter periplasmic adaptor subunit [Muribaculaceae bacterium]|nr:HlyD family efflux transporter periplasmic adaptor subunit [Muribaculaceae bacterium]